MDAALSELVPLVEPESLYKPVRYVLSAPGKRVRALFTLAASETFRGDPEVAASAALAVELFHAFTLVHDDIMDRSSTRRGRPTVHVEWDEPTAILVGDYLQGLAYQHLNAFPDPSFRQAHARMDRAVRELCEGQMRDMTFEARVDVTLEEYLEMIAQKTGALLQASLCLGALAGNATDEDIRHLEKIGGHIGLAFQIQDDLLDLTAETPSWGKPVGGDLIAGKKSYVLLKGLECSEGDERDWFAAILERGLDPSDVGLARNRMKELGVLEAALSSVIFHSDRALAAVETLPRGLGRDVIAFLIEKMKSRVH